jgi:hypothetical protein
VETVSIVQTAILIFFLSLTTTLLVLKRLPVIVTIPTTNATQNTMMNVAGITTSNYYPFLLTNIKLEL